ncbi:hypothetical protein [Actinophytocola sp.]|uniref:hypothetical protein n=1 Tax=Actinophytocola sp. TaxID=1872138 RepID=UPI002D297B12|nr:hypothetical protein [Actinophytocola sp.]HYQ68788.1 hypothetical protein [Actinophytocola sp.]
MPARELATRLDLPFPEALAKSPAAEYNRLVVSPPTTRTVQERVAGCRWLLLVDGLDENAGGADRDRLVSTLTGWASQDGSRAGSSSLTGHDALRWRFSRSRRMDGW